VAVAAATVLRGGDGGGAGGDMSLAAQFLRAEALYHHVVESSPMPGDLADECAALGGGGGAAAATGGCAHPVAHLPDAIAAFERAAAAVRREGTFSSNEGVADIATGDLQYLLIDYYEARLRQQTPPDSGRLAALLRAKFGLETFLAKVVEVGVVSAEEAAASGIDAYVATSRRRDEEESAASEARDRSAARVAAAAAAAGDDGDAPARGATLRGGASGGAGGGGGGGGRRTGEFGVAAGRAGVDPGQVRALRVARFKRNGETKKRLQELALISARRVRLAAMTGGGLEAAVEAGELDGVGAAASAGPTVDEDIRREMTLLTIVSAARSAVDEIVSIGQELPMLMHREALARAGGGGGAGGAGAASDSRMRPTGPPPGDPSIDPARKGLVRCNSTALASPLVLLLPTTPTPLLPRHPLQEITRIDPTFAVTREVVKAEVFTERFKPPSMTMEEWGDIVTERRLEREERERVQNESRVRTLGELVETGEEDKEALHDAATARARRMDDWADGVPKGSGVTKRV